MAIYVPSRAIPVYVNAGGQYACDMCYVCAATIFELFAVAY